MRGWGPFRSDGSAVETSDLVAGVQDPRVEFRAVDTWRAKQEAEPVDEAVCLGMEREGEGGGSVSS